jgi:hypothetical protein
LISSNNFKSRKDPKVSGDFWFSYFSEHSTRTPSENPKTKKLPLQFIRNTSSIAKPLYQRPQRFTVEEKKLLINSYCIIKARASDSVLLWGPMTTPITQHTPTECKLMITELKKQAVSFIKIENTKAKWIKYYWEGVEKNKIQEEPRGLSIMT